MAKKDSISLFNIAKHLLQAYLKKISDVTQLATLEAQLAGRTFITMMVLFVVLFFFLISTWLSLLVLLFFFFIWLQFSSLAASAMIVLFNALVVLSTCVYLKQIKKNLFFPATRRQLAHFSFIRRRG
ncbi:MAG: hypothetical protein H0W64_08830 [Gammaproteobacteria bacterium]|nr:hypothetical protein [Gammaproteobacteria bacterium]